MNSIDDLILPFFRSLELDRYLLDPEVSELMITNGLVFVEKAGRITEIEGIPIDERRLRAGVEIIGHSLGDQIDDYRKPWLDARSPDGSRVAATYPPISPQGVVVTTASSCVTSRRASWSSAARSPQRRSQYFWPRYATARTFWYRAGHPPAKQP